MCGALAGDNSEMNNARPSFSPQLPKIPDGTVVASFSSYEQAREAVDTLARREGFSLQQISIVGSDLKSVERVIGRMSAARAAMSGAVTGTMMGLFVTLMWLLIYPEAGFSSILGVFLLAIAFGTIWSLLAYALSPRKREFTSMMQLTASRFDLLVPHALAAQAAQVLGVQAAADGGHIAQAPQVQAPTAQNTTAPHDAGGATAQASQASLESPGADVPADGSGTQAQRPRTYGEVQDELRRKQAQERDEQEE